MGGKARFELRVASPVVVHRASGGKPRFALANSRTPDCKQDEGCPTRASEGGLCGWQANLRPQGLERTFAHELGHCLGAGNYTPSCGVNDAVMQDTFDCGLKPSTTVSMNDSLPVVNTVYNGKSRRSCGF